MKTCKVCGKWEALHSEEDRERCLKIKLDGVNTE